MSKIRSDYLGSAQSSRLGTEGLGFPQGEEPDYDYNDPSNYQIPEDDYVAVEWDGPAKPGTWLDWLNRPIDKGDKWWDPINGSSDEIPSNVSPGAMRVSPYCMSQYLTVQE